MKLKLNKILEYICILLAFFMFGFIIMYSDMKITSVGSFAILQGHLLDFYDYSVGNGFSPELVYFPTMYFLFALWNLPAYFLLGHNAEAYGEKRMTCLLYYDKLLVLIFFLLSIYVIYKILKKYNSETSLNCKFIIKTIVFSPFLYIAELAFGTYDYLYMLFALLGIYFYLNSEHDKNWWIKFSLMFGISFTIKQLTIFIWLPLLLYKEKNVWNIVKNFIVAFLFYFIEIVMYVKSPYFFNSVLKSHFIGFLTRMTLNNGMCNISIWGILFSIFAIICYLKKCEGNDIRIISWIAMTGPMILLLTSHWTINWILLFIPFEIILVNVYGENKKWFIIDLAYGVLFVLMLFYQQVGYWGYEYYGEGMLDYSVLSFLRDNTDRIITPNLVSEQLYTLIMGAMYGIMIMWLVMLCPLFRKKYDVASEGSDIRINAREDTLLYVKFIIVTLVYLLPIFVGVM